MSQLLSVSYAAEANLQAISEFQSHSGHTILSPTTGGKEHPQHSIQRILELRMDSKISCSFLYRLDTETQRAINSYPKSPGHSAAEPVLKPRSQAQDCLFCLSTPPLISAKPMSSHQ